MKLDCIWRNHDWLYSRSNSFYRRCSKCGLLQKKKVVKRLPFSFWPFPVDEIIFWENVKID